MPEFDVEAFVTRLERMGLKLTSVRLADGKFRINRWRMLNAGENTQQIQDLWASQIGDDQARMNALAAHLARTPYAVTASRSDRAGNGASETAVPHTAAAPTAPPIPQPPQGVPLPKPTVVQTIAGSPKVAAVSQPAPSPQRVLERTFGAPKLPGIQKLPGVPAVPGMALSPQKATELRPAAGLPKPATPLSAALPSKSGLSPAAAPLKPAPAPPPDAPKLPGIGGTASIAKPAAPPSMVASPRANGAASGPSRAAAQPAAAPYKPAGPQIGAGLPKPQPPSVGLQKAK
jgi:hypothetical protein